MKEGIFKTHAGGSILSRGLYYYFLTNEKMKKKTIGLFIVLSSFLIQSQCRKERGHEIEVFNHSPQSIYYALSFYYPETALTNNVNEPTPGNLILPNEKDNIEPGVNLFDFNDVLQVYFISADTLDLLGWNYVKDHHAILQRKEYRISDIEAADYKIYYP